ncbi:cGMP-dependent 3',5'-cyclic phosphodiesterase-like isoform X6 [Pomacea canaliculata]|uniref:cGMP-dependent 3',5'-cyclic phosphodiesterase-like isoform X6 n=1 Tax=Pomacea canaliculata TaxID=400727 RepID=UPI000D7343EA|nr:cGMP-dependent 3',5'-cyclic phosphodiesterase-like isoform X6 [Pomacea canaliculata]
MHSKIRAIGNSEERKPSGTDVQDVFMPILDATNLTELRNAACDTLKHCLPNVERAHVFLTNPENQQVEADGIILPKRGFAWDAFRQKSRQLCSVPFDPDPFIDLLALHSTDVQKVLLAPVPARRKDSNIGIIVASVTSVDLTASEDKYMELLLKQISVSYESMKLFMSEPATENSQLESLIALCADLHDQDAAQLELKVIKYLREHTCSESGFLLLVVPETLELISQVVGSTILPEEVRFPGLWSCFAQALETKQPMFLEHIPQDRRAEVEKIVEKPVHSFLCVPVACKDSHELIALACLVNKSNGQRFGDDDIQIVRQCFKYTATVLTSTLAFQNERKLKNQTQALLHVARKLFTRLDDLTKLLREIMQEARNLTDAERCSVFLLDQDSDELVATVFDGISTNNKEAQAEIRLPKTQGIAGHVATTGTLLNIKDAYSHPLFYRGIDDSTGFRTRNILCFPIKDEEGVVLGVAQLCNKKTGTYFTTFDEDIASAFAVYCCISISHSLMYKKVIDIQYRNSLANELMMFHMKCLIYKKLRDTQHRNKLANELMIFHMQQIPTEEVTELAGKKIPNIKKINPVFDQFVYPPRSLAETQTPLACMSMFDDLGLSTRWRLKRDTLARFLLMVKKGYRNPPYHNWMHAFAVGHFGYLCIKNLKLDDLLDDIELLAFFVSCLCHDIDHRGTTNSFQVKSQSVLAALYSSEGSVMERHHLAQSMCILNTEGSNIFENLTSKEYQQVLDLMRDIILATDLAHHLRIYDSLQTMATRGYNKNDPKCHNLLLCLLMTASDLSDQTKSWNNTKHIAVLIYQEFFSQGDLEKALGESPIEMMDRERACVPDLQISFLDNIAIPVYRVLAEVFPEAQCIADCVHENRQHWVHKAQLLKMHNSSAQTMSVQEIIALGEEEEEVGSHHENS